MEKANLIFNDYHSTNEIAESNGIVVEETRKELYRLRKSGLVYRVLAGIPNVELWCNEQRPQGMCR